MPIAVMTGGTGFVGGRVLQSLLSRGIETRVVTSGTVARQHVADAESLLSWWSSSDEDLDAATRGADYFFHFAVVYDKEGIADETLRGVNIELPLRIIRRLDPRAACLVADTFFRKFPVTATRQRRYTSTKIELADRLAGMAGASGGGTRIALLQLEHVYGPGDAFSKVLPGVTRRMLRHEPRIALTQGRQQRDLVHVEDVVAAVWAVIEAPWQGLQVVECGSGQAVAIREVFEQLWRLTGSRSVLGFGDLPADQTIASSVADLQWLAACGWCPRVDLESGLGDMVKDIAHRLTRACS